MNAYTIGVLISFVIYIVVGNYAGSKVKGVDDYYVSGRNAPTILIVGSLIASYASTGAMLGETGFSYEGYAIPLLVLIALNGSGYILGAYYFGRYLRRSKALTVPEFFGNRFNSRKVRAAAGGTSILALAGYLLAVTQGTSILMSELLGISYGMALVIVWIAYTSFTFYSGSKGVILTDTMMFFVFAIVLGLAAPMLIGKVGGWTAWIDKLAVFDIKPGILSWQGKVGLENSYWATGKDSIIWAIILGLAWMLSVGVSPWQSSRYLMAKNEHVVLRSAVLSTIGIPVLYVFIVIIGTSINLINPDLVPEKAFIWAARNVLPTWLGMLIYVGILAAGLSSCSTFLSLVGFSTTIDVFNITSDKDEKAQLRASRIVMILIGLVVLAVAFVQPPSIFWITYFSGTVLASSWGVVAFMSIWSKKITALGAFLGMILGFIGNAGFKIASTRELISLPVYLDPVVIGLVFSIIGIIIGSAITQVSEEESKQRERLFIVPEEEMKEEHITVTMRYPKIMLGAGILLILFFVFVYAIPYGKVMAKL